jgi:hypothetical protein
MNTDNIGVKGAVEIFVTDVETGEIVRTIREHNLVVNLGKSNICYLLGGSASGKVINQIGVGTGSFAATALDTLLHDVYRKPLNTDGTVNIYGTGTVTFGFNIHSGEANGMTIWEVGLFDAGNNLNARKVLSTPIVKSSSFAITGTWTLTIG